MIPGRMCNSEEVKQQHRQKAKEADVNEHLACGHPGLNPTGDPLGE